MNATWICPDCGEVVPFDTSHNCLAALHAQDIDTHLTLNFNPNKSGDNDPTANINWEVTGKIIKVGGNNDIIFNFTDIVEQLKRIVDALERIANK